jgi:hypothetical protein
MVSQFFEKLSRDLREGKQRFMSVPISIVIVLRILKFKKFEKQFVDAIKVRLNHLL